MTDSQMQGICAQTCNMAQRDIEQLAGGFNFLIGSYYNEDKQLYRMRRVEGMIMGLFGKDWLNNDNNKEAAFRVLRKAVDRDPPDAMIFASMANRVEDGAMEVLNVLVVLVQTRERACMYWQNIDRNGNPDGRPEIHFIPQDDLDGRLKMYGSRIKWINSADHPSIA
jgi:hypothetical protein